MPDCWCSKILTSLKLTLSGSLKRLKGYLKASASGTSESAKSSLHLPQTGCRLLFYSAGLTATAAFAAAAAAIAFFRFKYEFPQEEEYAGEHNHADDNILSHNDCIHLVVW